jgi:hypothetical protein
MPTTPKTARLFCIFFLGAMSVLIVSCATHSPKAVTTFNATTSNLALKNTLVVSIGKERADRIKMERAIVERINSKDTKAKGVTLLLPTQTDLSKDSVTRLVEQNSFDNVLVIRLVQSAVKVEVDEKRSELIIERPQPEKLLDIFVQNYKEVDIQREMRVNATVIISADLYSGVSGNRLWSAYTTVIEGTEADSIISDAAESIVKQLMKET